MLNMFFSSSQRVQKLGHRTEYIDTLNQVNVRLPHAQATSLSKTLRA